MLVAKVAREALVEETFAYCHFPEDLNRPGFSGGCFV
jgi:hypothetical protein